MERSFVLRPATDCGNEEESRPIRPTDRMGPLEEEEGMGDLGTNKRREIAPIKYAPSSPPSAGYRGWPPSGQYSLHSMR